MLQELWLQSAIQACVKSFIHINLQRFYFGIIAVIKYYNIQNDWHDWNLVRVEIVFYCQKM